MVIDALYLFCHQSFILFAGVPTYTPQTSIFLITVAPAPIIVLETILTQGMTAEPIPIKTSAPIPTPPAMWQPGAMWQKSPITQS